MTEPEPNTEALELLKDPSELAPMGTRLTRTEPSLPAPFTLVPHNLSEAMEFAKLIATSNLCPNDYRGKPADVLMAVQMGLEIAGCSPLQALQNIAVINGRPTMWGDLVLGVVRNSGLLAGIVERDPQECMAKKEGRCEVVRKDDPNPVIRTFTYQMATDAGLIRRSGGSGPWTTHPGRMLQMRARAWALRDGFADVLRGLRIREEEQDTEAITATPVRTMPRRASEAKAGGTEAMDAFLAEQGKPQAPAQSAPQAPPAPATANGNTWTGAILDVAVKTGSTRGKEWTLFTICTKDGGEFGTFSDTIADEARLAMEHDLPVTITWSVTAKGNKNIVTLSPVEEQDDSAL